MKCDVMQKFQANLNFVLLTFLTVLCSNFTNNVMAELEEQRAVIKFFAKTGDTPMQCWNKLKEGFRDRMVMPKTVRQWFRKFNSGVTSIKDKPRPGRPKSVRVPDNIQKVQACLQEDRHSTLQELSLDVGIKKTSLYSILKKDLKMSKLAPKFAPKVLTD